MNWYVVDKEYIDYLSQFDSRLGYVEYGERLKLHVGILLAVNSCHYYVPISSAKPKHQRMSNRFAPEGKDYYRRFGNHYTTQS